MVISSTPDPPADLPARSRAHGRSTTREGSARKARVGSRPARGPLEQRRRGGGVAPESSRAGSPVPNAARPRREWLPEQSAVVVATPCLAPARSGAMRAAPYFFPSGGSEGDAREMRRSCYPSRRPWSTCCVDGIPVVETGSASRGCSHDDVAERRTGSRRARRNGLFVMPNRGTSVPPGSSPRAGRGARDDECRLRVGYRKHARRSRATSWRPDEIAAAKELSSTATANGATRRTREELPRRCAARRGGAAALVEDYARQLADGRDQRAAERSPWQRRLPGSCRVHGYDARARTTSRRHRPRHRSRASSPSRGGSGRDLRPF